MASSTPPCNMCQLFSRVVLLKLPESSKVIAFWKCKCPSPCPSTCPSSMTHCSRNHVPVEGATHKQVVDLIKSCGDSLTLTVISVTPEEADRLEPADVANYPCVDYSEKRSLPISVPDFRYMDQDGERFVVSSRRRRW